ncbi:MAG: hypothetical protein LBS60_10450 [Deltaproteobacteria bacterium]|nr:hypothetical protein [Deltaproteobacteria bacterium]
MDNPDSGDDWIDKARLEIYEETKDMSSEEILEYFRKSSEEAAKKYGLKFVNSPDSKDNNNNS